MTIEIDRKHEKEMDALARMATCEACGHVGLSKNGSVKSGSGEALKILLRYKCPNCNRSYHESRLADLLNGKMAVREVAKPVLTTTKAKTPTPTPAKGADRVSVLEAQLTTLLEQAEAIRQEIEAEKSRPPEPEKPPEGAEYVCPDCGDPLWKAGWDKSDPDHPVQRFKCKRCNKRVKYPKVKEVNENAQT